MELDLRKTVVTLEETRHDGGPSLDIPLHHINAAYVRSHFSTVEIGVTDAPKSDEIMFAPTMSAGPRPHARVGGLKASEIKEMDGLR